MALHILSTTPELDYELIDSGNGEKLERYGSVILSRPDPQVLWSKKASSKKWKSVQAHFSKSDEKSGWKLDASLPQRWPVSIGGLKFWIKPSAFKHTGVFPEQKSNWQWIEKTIQDTKKDNQKISVLNLFGYTGGATLAALKSGAEVCHVDGSKTAVTNARENAELNEFSNRPVRWIVDDVMVFLKREIKRGNTYDAVIMDPPSFGRGPKGEVWKIEEHFTDLLELVKKVLKPKPLFVLINGYAAGYSALAYEYCIENIIDSEHIPSGTLEAGELTIQESEGKRFLPAGIFARWARK